MPTHHKPPTGLVTYTDPDDLTRGIHDRVRAKLAAMELVPVHRRTTMEVLFGLNGTLLDEEEFFRQHGARDAAATEAVRSRGSLMVAVADLGALPSRVAQAHQLHGRQHDVAMKKLDYESASYEAAISDCELQVEQNRARIERLKAEAAQSGDGRTRTSGRMTAQERAFTERLDADRGIRERLAAAIAEIQAMDIPEEERAARIKAVTDSANDFLNGAN